MAPRQSSRPHVPRRQFWLYLATDAPTPDYKASRLKEIHGLIEKGVFDFIDESTVPLGTRIFGSRFVDSIKNPRTKDTFKKSRLVVQAFNDLAKAKVLT